MITKLLTLCLIRKDNQVLLGMKKRGFGEGLWNGFGGKPHEDETLEQAAIREVSEEVSLTVQGLKKHGAIQFSFSHKPDEILEVHIFSSTDFAGEPQESEEMKPQWFSFDEIPYGRMWPDDTYWLPLLLQDKQFTGKFHFDEHNKILDYSLHEG